MLATVLGRLERGRHVEDLFAVLDRDDAAGGKMMAVARPVDLIDDRRMKIPATHEIGMQRMHHAILDRGARSNERLAEHLAAKHLG